MTRALRSDETQPIRGRAKVAATRIEIEDEMPAGTLEIAGRSPDSDSDTPDDRFRRSFTVAEASLADEDHTEATHDANRNVVAREAINHGLSPLGEATFDGADELEGQPGQLVLRYSVAVDDGLSDESEN